MPDVANVDTSTTGAVFIPEVWSELVLEFRKKRLQAANFFERRDMEVMNFGDTIHFPSDTEYTVVDYTQGNRLTSSLEANTEDEITLTVDQYKVRPFVVSDKLSKQSQYDKKALNFRNAGYAIAKAIDSAIFARSSEFTNAAINTAGTAVVPADLTEAQETLDNLDVPEGEERGWFLSPSTIKDLMDNSGNYFTSLDFSQTQSLVYGQLHYLLLGSPVYKSTNLPTGTTGSPATTYRKNIYAHKEAIGVAMQIAPEVQESYEVDLQGTLCNVRALYGTVCLRPESGVIINGR